MKKILMCFFLLFLFFSCQTTSGEDERDPSEVGESPTQEGQDDVDTQSAFHSPEGQGSIQQVAPEQLQSIDQKLEQSDTSENFAFSIEDDPEVEFYPNTLDAAINQNTIDDSVDTAVVQEELLVTDDAQALTPTIVEEDMQDESSVIELTEALPVADVNQSFIPLTEEGEVEDVAEPFDSLTAPQVEQAVIDLPTITVPPAVEDIRPQSADVEVDTNQSLDVSDSSTQNTEQENLARQDRQTFIYEPEEELDIDENEDSGDSTQSGNYYDLHNDILQHIQLYQGDTVDITLPGQGWIYLGELEFRDPSIMKFRSRITEDGNTLFDFYANTIGTADLHFYKQDLIEDVYLDEYIRVSVLAEHEVLSGDAQDQVAIIDTSFGNESSDISESNDTSTLLDTDVTQMSLLDLSELAFTEGRYIDSVALLDEYSTTAVTDIDRALYLYAQNYESDSSIRNIRRAYESYERIVESYPQSKYWDDAAKRKTYIERFYFSIN